MSERLQHTELIHDRWIQYFSEGKTPGGNDDLVVLQNNAITVIDGATAAVPFSVDDKSSGAYAAQILQSIVTDMPENVLGNQWVDVVCRRFNETLLKSPVSELIVTQPEARPCASILHSFLSANHLYITQVGDVSFRLNGRDVYRNDKKIDQMHATMRQKVMKKLQEQVPDIDMENTPVTG